MARLSRKKPRKNPYRRRKNPPRPVPIVPASPPAPVLQSTRFRDPASTNSSTPAESPSLLPPTLPPPQPSTLQPPPPSTLPPSPPANLSRFLSLPAEIRNMIYEHSFPRKVREGPLLEGGDESTLQAAGLVCTCRQMHAETEPLFLRSRIHQMRLLHPLCESRFNAYVSSAYFGREGGGEHIIPDLAAFSVDAYVGYIFSPYFMRFHRRVFQFEAPVSGLPPVLSISEPLSGYLYVHKSRIVTENEANPDWETPESCVVTQMSNHTWSHGFRQEDLPWLVQAVRCHTDFTLADVDEEELRALWGDIAEVGEEEEGEEGEKWVLGSRFVQRDVEYWDKHREHGFARIV